MDFNISLYLTLIMLGLDQCYVWINRLQHEGNKYSVCPNLDGGQILHPLLERKKLCSFSKIVIFHCKRLELHHINCR